MKKIKGTEGYLSKQKKIEILKTVICFGISLILFIIGYVTTKTKGNLLTIVAVLGCLPASKCAVNMIMHLRIRECSKEAKEQLLLHSGNLNGYFNLYFTSYSKNYPTSYLVITANSILAYCESPKVVPKDFENHIKDLLIKDGVTDITVKLYLDLPKYIARLDELNNGTINVTENNSVKKILFATSL